MTRPKSSATLLKYVSIDVRMNSGQLLVMDLQITIPAVGVIFTMHMNGWESYFWVVTYFASKAFTNYKT